MAVVTKENVKAQKAAAKPKKESKPRQPKNWSIAAIRKMASTVNSITKNPESTDEQLAQAQHLSLEIYCAIRANRRGYHRVEGDFDRETGLLASTNGRTADEIAARNAEREAAKTVQPDPVPATEPKTSKPKNAKTSKPKGRAKKSA